MSWADILSRIEFKSGSSNWGFPGVETNGVTPFTGAEEALIIDLLRNLYEGSAAVRGLLEGFGSTIRIGSSVPDTADGRIAYAALGAQPDYIGINLDRVGEIFIFNPVGELVQIRLETILAHELYHLITLAHDPARPAPEIDPGNFDYVGDPVRFENIVNREMGWEENVRVSYGGRILSSSAEFAAMNIGESYSGGQSVDIVRVGTDAADTLDMTARTDNSRDLLFGYGSSDWLRGGGGDDFLYGGTHADLLEGGSGRDWLFGEGGGDILVGEAGGDRYFFGVGDGQDIVEDRGGSGTDTLVLRTGNLASEPSANWFHRDGDDLLVRVPNGHGGYAIDVRIRDMGTSAGGIERVEVWGGDGDEPTSQAWSLTAIWEELTRSGTPSTPDPNDGTDAPDPDEPSDNLIDEFGGSGGDDMVGGNGDDGFAGLGGDDQLYGDDGDDILVGNAGDDELRGEDGDDLLLDDDEGSLYEDLLLGGDGDDSLVFYGAPEDAIDRGDGGSGRDLAYVDLGDSSKEWRVATDDDGDVVVELDSGTSEGEIRLADIEVIAVRFGDDDDYGDSYADGGSDDLQAYFEGGAGNDDLRGGRENDYLDGGSGDDHLNGERGVDWLDGGSGDDSVRLDLSDETRNLSFVADEADSSSGYTLENGTHVRSAETIELITGSGDDRIWLGDGGDDVTTGAGDDLISTTLEGRDSVDGGSGHDRLIVDLSGGSARLRANYDSEDDDFEIFSGSQYASATRALHVSDFEEVTLRGGSANDDLDGGTGDDELVGADGDDRLDGRAGDDRMEGGAGDDDFALRDGADWADGGAGDDYGDFDRIDSELDFFFDGRLAASSAGTTLADGTFVRNIERWSISLGNGDDVVAITLNRDNLFYLGNGDDRVLVDHHDQASALFAGGTAYSYEYVVSAGEMYDGAIDRLKLLFAEHFTLLGGAAGDQLAGLGGSDRLEGNSGDDVLLGGAGDDLLSGGASNDRIEGGDGFDRASYADAAAAVQISLQRSAAQNSGGAGTDTLIGIEALLGSAFADTLGGDFRANLLDGGGGADTLSGGQGEDVYVVDDAGDRVFEKDGEGSDLVRSGVTFSLAGQFVEVLELTGAAAINGTGNGLANRLVGNSAANVLFGMAGNDRLDGQGGADRMRGGAGNDVYVVDDAGDVVEENDGEGSDTVEASIGYSLVGRYVELLVLTGSASINGTGNGLANTLIGNGGANVLDGRGGADSLRGGGGDDRYIVDHAGDTVVELAGEGHDVVEAAMSFSLAGQYAEELRLTGSAAINGTGNSLANAIHGNAANNLLRGEGGADVLGGGLGMDTLLGGAGQDQYWFETALGATNIDTIGDFNVADDTVYLDRTIFSGIAADGTLAAGAFRLGTAAVDADDRILYDAATGNLRYDRDGAGGVAAVQFAKLGTGLALTAADFAAGP